MSKEFKLSTGVPSEEMADYLQMYLDETAEQLDGLVEALLILEGTPTDSEQLNEAFRLIHSIKGSSALMGFDSITVLTHQLENHFEQLRSGSQSLDRAMMDLILRCVDFLRDCNRRLRAGESLGGSAELLEELRKQRSASPAPIQSPAETTARAGHPSRSQAATTDAPPKQYRVVIHLEAALQLPDLKAELVLTRLAEVGRVRQTLPARQELEKLHETQSFQVLLTSERSLEDIRLAADVSGIELIEIEESGDFAIIANTAPLLPVSTELPTPDATTPSAAKALPDEALEAQSPSEKADEITGEAAAPVSSEGAESVDAKSKVVETVRVDIDRLDNLLNLAGELVVNKARFVQIARQMSPAFKKTSLSARARAFGESMRRALQSVRSQNGNGDASQAEHWMQHFHELESEIDALEEQSRLWEESRRHFGQITEAIDQLTRVSDSLQRGVLDTRMVPVAPLFNRFKRVVRDIALELNKKVHLEIHGEKTELDKRMIDELGDPLVHLVRNAIDHGIEPAEVRARRGKPETGTICLEAAHSGNNVFITVRDDGGGLQTERIRQRIIERGLVSAEAAAEMPERELVEFIWDPGFSTADAVSDISGRGVGMDIVKTRIAELNGTIDIQHAVGLGTTFTIRLPLTLAIVRSLLFRLSHGVFAVPIDNVQEIVSVPVNQIVTIHNRQTFDVRGEFIPLVDIDDIFDFHDMEYDYAGYGGVGSDADAKRVNVVVLHTANKTIGLKVNELHGSQDIVIKSLAENFVHIRGLSGASILGDGSVCLLLDVGAALDLIASKRQRAS